MSHATARTDLACRNCGTQAPLKFCPECGQETTLHPPRLGEFLHEFVGHYVALEGALWRTLRLLLTKPGRLTREYLAGRRRQYVLPLRLYLTASFLFFLVLKLTPGVMDRTVAVSFDGRRMGISEYEAEVASATVAAPPGAASAPHRPRFELFHPFVCGAASQPVCNRPQAFMNAAAARFEEHPQETLDHARTHMLGLAPYAIFLLLPAFAGIVMLAYRNRRMTYGEHVVFSLHLHAFWFVASTVITIAPESIGSLLQLLVPVYGTWAMHEAYGGRWVATIARAVLVTLVYGSVLVIVLAALSMVLLMTG